MNRAPHVFDGFRARATPIKCIAANDPRAPHDAEVDPEREAFYEAADRAPKPDRCEPLSREGRKVVAEEHRVLEVRGQL